MVTSRQLFIEYLQCTKHGFKHFTYTNPFYLYNNPIK